MTENATSKFVLTWRFFLNKGLVDNKPVVFSYLKGQKEEITKPTEELFFLCLGSIGNH